MNINQIIIVILLMAPICAVAQESPAAGEAVSASVQLNDAMNTVEQYRQQMEEKDLKISELKNFIESMNIPKINDARFLRANILPTSASFYVETNAYGKVFASIFDETNPSRSAGEYEGEGRGHRILFEGLSPARRYFLVMETDLPSGERARISFNMRLDLSSDAPIAPQIPSRDSFITAAQQMSEPNSRFKDEPLLLQQDSVTLELITDQTVQLDINCKVRVPGVPDAPCRSENYGGMLLDDVGRPGANSKLYQNGDHLVIDGLVPDTEYVFSGVAVNTRGMRSVIDFPVNYRTLVSPMKLDFDGPLNIVFIKDNLSISWKSTGNFKDSYSKIIFDLGRDISIEVKAAYNDDKKIWIAEIPFNSIFSAIKPKDQTQNSGQNAEVPVPKLTVMMSSDSKYTNPIKREFSISIKKSLETNLGSVEKKQVTALLEAISPKVKERKFFKLAKAGLPLVMAIFGL